MQYRFLKGILATILCIGFISISVFAFAADPEPVPELNVGQVQGLFKSGRAEIPVMIYHIPGVAAGQFTIKRMNSSVDIEGFTFDEEFKKQFEKTAVYLNGKDSVTIAFVSSKNQKFTVQKLGTLTCNVDRLSQNASVPLSILSDDFSDEMGNRLVVEKRQGMIMKKRKLGDANGDDLVNTADSLLALKIAVGERVADQEQKQALDINRDSRVTASDVMLILRYTVDLIPSFFMISNDPNIVALAGTNLNYVFIPVNGRAPFTWSLVKGKLPSGLQLDSYGMISGTPTRTGKSTFTVRVTDSDHYTVEKEFTIEIIKASN